jgi:octaprenyl-diphosphate synthase
VSQTVNAPDSGSSLARSLYQPVLQELAAVEKLLHAELRSPYHFVDEVVRYGGQLGGKRLRPALLLLTAKAIGKVTRDHVVLATVVEMIHTATLVHDDVLDEADKRRHLATVNARWDNQTSVLLGDFLFTHAFYLASTLGSTLACRTIGAATNTVCEGELRQTGNHGRHDLSEQEYLSIIDAKTAELCACCCHLGATFADASEDLVESMSRYGRNLGIAFQIADDLLDLFGQEERAGKSLGTDLQKQKPTLPLIHVWQQCNDAQRLELARILQGSSARRRQALDPWFDKFAALDYARNRARDFATRARNELESLPASPARDILNHLTLYVIQRSH